MQSEAWPLIKGTLLVLLLILLHFWQDPGTAFWLAMTIVATVAYLRRKREDTGKGEKLDELRN